MDYELEDLIEIDVPGFDAAGADTEMEETQWTTDETEGA